MKQSPQVEWPPEWGAPSQRALAFSASRVPALAVGTLVAAAGAAAVSHGLVTWAVVFVFCVALTAMYLRSLPRPQVFWTALVAGVLTLGVGRAWVETPGPTMRLYAVLFFVSVPLGILVTWLDRRRGRGQRISVKTRVRPEYRLSPNGLNWGAGDFERVGWGAMTSVEPVAASDRSLDIVTGAYRVVIRGERDGLLDLTETFYGPAATLFLLQHYIAHAEGRAELAGVWRFESRARRAAHARLTYPQAQPQLTQPSAAQQPG